MWRVIARRAASICRAVTRSGSVAFRAKEPKLRRKPPLASAWIRPLCILRYFVRFACSIVLYSLRALAVAAGAARRRAVRSFRQTTVMRLRIMLKDLALEDPDLDADDPIGGFGFRQGIVDVGPQGMQRHAAFAIPFGPGDFRAAKAAADVHPDAKRTHPHRVLHAALHGATEGHAALHLLGDGLGHQLGVDLGLADLDDVEVQFRLRERGKLLAQRLDVGALLADDHARTGGVDRHPALLVRALDDHAADAGLLGFLVDELAHPQVFKQEVAVVLRLGEPAAVPGAVDLETHTDRIDLLTHYADSPV